MKMRKTYLLGAVAILPFLASAEVAVALTTPEGAPLADREAVKVEIRREVGDEGLETVRCRLESTQEGTRCLLIVASVALDGGETHAFDGERERPLEGTVRNDLLLRDSFPMGAVWGATRGRALALGAEAGDSYADFACAEGRLVVSVHAALLGKGAVYETVFHSFPFSPKYGVMDAFARYYPLYPLCFKPHPDVDPDLYGICAHYSSWKKADPERCRLMNATWEWCFGAARTWGDLLDLEQPTLPRNGDYSWDEGLSYADRSGKKFRCPNGEVTQAQFDAMRDMRLGLGYYCGVHNSFYAMALANISPKIAARHPDSVITPNSFDDGGYAYSTPVFTFPECSWGQELRRQLKTLSETMEAGSPAFDVSKPRSVYRGVRLKEMKNVSWDEFGPGIVRGVANMKLFDYIHTLPVRNSRYRMGVSINSRSGHVVDKFHADITMTECTPWDYEKPYPLSRRLIAGEKGLTMWEGYSAQEIAPGFRNWPRADKDRLIDELAHFAVHASFRTGASLPAGFLSGYAALMSHAFVRLNRAGWKPVPGARANAGGTELARYGLGEDSFIALNNLSNALRKVEVALYPAELASGRALPAAGRTEGCPLYAPFFGGEARLSLAQGASAVSCDVGPMLATVLEATGFARGTGSLRIGEGGDPGCWRVTVTSDDFVGEVVFKERLDADYRLVGPACRRLDGGGCVVAEYRSSALAEPLAKIRTAGEFDEVRHAPDADSRDQAERIAYFLRKAAGKRSRLRLVSDSALAPRTVSLAGATVTAADRQDFMHLVKRLIDVLHRERFPRYKPSYPMPKKDCRLYPQLRL